MKVLIITGGLGSGKSMISACLAERGVPVYDCDSRAKALYEVYPSLKAMLCADIFSQPLKLKALEDALFPLLMKDFREWAAGQGKELVGMESATILQKSFFDGFGDWVMLVEAPLELRVERAVARGGEEADIRRRIALQADHSSNPRVSVRIDNSSSREYAEEQVDKFLKYINYGK